MKLPAEVYSALGPVSVAAVPLSVLPQGTDGSETVGSWNGERREIRVSDSLAPVVRVQTMFHEVMHLILCDSGAQYGLDDETTERLCDAVGTYFASAVASGHLRFGKPYGL